MKRLIILPALLASLMGNAQVHTRTGSDSMYCSSLNFLYGNALRQAAEYKTRADKAEAVLDVILSVAAKLGRPMRYHELLETKQIAEAEYDRRKRELGIK